MDVCLCIRPCPLAGESVPDCIAWFIEIKTHARLERCAREQLHRWNRTSNFLFNISRWPFNFPVGLWVLFRHSCFKIKAVIRNRPGKGRLSIIKKIGFQSQKNSQKCSPLHINVPESPARFNKRLVLLREGEPETVLPSVTVERTAGNRCHTNLLGEIPGKFPILHTKSRYVGKV